MANNKKTQQNGLEMKNLMAVDGERIECRFCFSASGELISNICHCKGSDSFVHTDCLMRDVTRQITVYEESGPFVPVCSVCRRHLANVRFQWGNRPFREWVWRFPSSYSTSVCMLFSSSMFLFLFIMMTVPLNFVGLIYETENITNYGALYYYRHTTFGQVVLSFGIVCCIFLGVDLTCLIYIFQGMIKRNINTHLLAIKPTKFAKKIHQAASNASSVVNINETATSRL